MESKRLGCCVSSATYVTKRSSSLKSFGPAAASYSTTRAANRLLNPTPTNLDVPYEQKRTQHARCHRHPAPRRQARRSLGRSMHACMHACMFCMHVRRLSTYTEIIRLQSKPFPQRPHHWLLPNSAGPATALLRRGIKTEARLLELGVQLPPAGVPKGNFVMAARSGRMVYLCA